MTPPRTWAGPDDPDLTSAVAAGDPHALDFWYRAELGVVHRLSAGFLADQAEAEDLAQDAMLHLADRLHRRDPESPYRSWRNRVVVNLCRDRLRRLALRARPGEAPIDELELPAAIADPSDLASRTEVQATLFAALARLTDREREVFVLRDLEEQSTGAVAAQLSIGASTVRTISTLARRRLRGLLGAAAEAVFADREDRRD